MLIRVRLLVCVVAVVVVVVVVIVSTIVLPRAGVTAFIPAAVDVLVIICALLRCCVTILLAWVMVGQVRNRSMCQKQWLWGGCVEVGGPSHQFFVSLVMSPNAEDCPRPGYTVLDDTCITPIREGKLVAPVTSLAKPSQRSVPRKSSPVNILF